VCNFARTVASGDRLTSRQGQVLQKKVARGVFGTLRKRL
jgi:hypothetical protein